MQIRRLRELFVEPLEQRQLLDAGSVVISEIMYHPAVDDVEKVSGLKDRDFEFIELTNTGETAAQLANSTLSDAIDFRFGQLTLRPGQQAVVVQDRQAFESRYGNQFLIAGEYNGTLGNGGDRIAFADSAGQPLQDITYDDAWYASTDGAGFSLVAIDLGNKALDRNVAESWQPSRRMNGSPGYADGELDPRPSNLVTSVKSSRHLMIRWDAIDQPSANVQAYRLYRDGQLIGTSAATSFLDSNIAPEHRYVYQVAALHADGTEYFSNPQIVETEAIGGDLAFASGTARGVVRAGLNELSGIISSRRYTNVFWTHNDGPQSAVHAINAQGELLGTILLRNIPSLDWEDITIGPGPRADLDYIYVGDIGGKDPKRNEVRVYRIPEPEISEDDSGNVYNIAAVDTITLTYPDGEAFNAETLLSDPRTGDLFVIPKLGSGTPIFRAAASRLNSRSTISLELVGHIGFPNVSGGDVSPSGNEILIRNEDLAQLFQRANGQSIANAFSSGNSQLVPVIGRPTEQNGEAITFDREGQNYYTISEGENATLYSFRRIPTAFAGDANRDGIFNSSDLVRAFQAAKYDTGRPALFSEGDWNGDGIFSSGDLVAAFQTGLFEKPNTSVRSVSASSLRNDDFDMKARRAERLRFERIDDFFATDSPLIFF